MRESLRALAGRMTQETDWFYGAAMRLEGQVSVRICSTICTFKGQQLEVNSCDCAYTVCIVNVCNLRTATA
jgi:hypothetical protein